MKKCNLSRLNQYKINTEHTTSSKASYPVHSRYSKRRHMLVLTLIARTTLLSPSATPSRPPSPPVLPSSQQSHPFLRIAFRFTRYCVASCPVSVCNTDISAAMSFFSVAVLHEYNILEKKKWCCPANSNVRRPMAEKHGWRKLVLWNIESEYSLATNGTGNCEQRLAIFPLDLFFKKKNRRKPNFYWSSRVFHVLTIPMEVYFGVLPFIVDFRTWSFP